MLLQTWINRKRIRFLKQLKRIPQYTFLIEKNELTATFYYPPQEELELQTELMIKITLAKYAEVFWGRNFIFKNLKNQF